MALAAAVAFGVFAVGTTPVALAQQPDEAGAQGGPPRAADRGPGGPGRGNFDPAQFRERMTEMAKETLEINDEDWKTVGPLLEKTVEAQMAVPRMGGFGRGMRRRGPDAGDAPGRPGGPGGPSGPGGPPRFTQSPEAEALQKVLDSKDSTKDQIQTAVKAFRNERTKKEKALQEARKELREVLTVRQEAMLVMYGLLD